jgi:hypothetical protein
VIVAAVPANRPFGALDEARDVVGLHADRPVTRS